MGSIEYKIYKTFAHCAVQLTFQRTHSGQLQANKRPNKVNKRPKMAFGTSTGQSHASQLVNKTCAPLVKWTYQMTHINTRKNMLAHIYYKGCVALGWGGVGWVITTTSMP